MTRALPVERVGDIRRGLLGLRDAREPQLPEAAVGRGGSEAVLMVRGERFQSDSVSFERDWGDRDHAQPRCKYERSLITPGMYSRPVEPSAHAVRRIAATSSHRSSR